MENDNKQKLNINWYPGHMAKTRREISEDIKLIDVVIEILDSRIPIASQNPDIQNIIKNKKKIILLNKCDLADEKETNKWIEHFKNNGIIAIKIDASSGKGMNDVIKKIEEIMKEDLEREAQKGRINKTIRVLVLGIPNVGKSSFINKMAKKNSLKVGNKPGVTLKKQWIRIGKNIELLDTPGVLWPKFESDEVGLNLAFTGTIKDEILPIEDIAFYLVKFLMKYHLSELCEKYKLEMEEVQEKLNDNINDNDIVLEILEMIGRKRGALVSRWKD